jgi:hypothetical protein
MRCLECGELRMFRATIFSEFFNLPVKFVTVALCFRLRELKLLDESLNFELRKGYEWHVNMLYRDAPCWRFPLSEVHGSEFLTSGALVGLPSSSREGSSPRL